MRVNYKVNDMLSLQGSVVNGWNGVGIPPDITGDKTYGVSANVNLPTGTNIVGTGYFGKGEAVFDATTMTAVASPDTRILVDLVVAQTMGALGLNLNFDYIKDASPATRHHRRLAHGPLRVNEHFALRRAATTVERRPGRDRVNQEEVTVGAAFPLGGRLELRPETRGGSPAAQLLPRDKDGTRVQSGHRARGGLASF